VCCLEAPWKTHLHPDAAQRAGKEPLCGRGVRGVWSCELGPKNGERFVELAGYLDSDADCRHRFIGFNESEVLAGDPATPRQFLL